MSKRPRTLGLGNVMLNSFTSHISNRPKEFSWAPKMPFSKVPSQPRVLLKNSVSRISFEKLKCLRNAHSSRNFNKQVYVVGLDRKLINLESMFVSNFSQNFFTKHFKFNKLKGVFRIFRLPYKMESILPYCVFKFLYVHFFISCAKFKNTAHATRKCNGACSDSVVHSLYSFQNLLRNRRFGLPSAKAQGILCM